jgi:hypothetical protein
LTAASFTRKVAGAEAEAEPIAGEADADAGAAGGLEVDPRIPHEPCRLGRCARALDEGEQSGRIRLPAERRVTADHVPKALPQPEPAQDSLARPRRLVGQHRHGHLRRERCERVHHPLIRRRVHEQPFVVQLDETRQGFGGLGIESGRLERAAHEHRRPFANHGGNLFLRQRQAATLGDQRVRGIRKVALGINKRPVEIEDDQPRCHAADEGR